MKRVNGLNRQYDDSDDHITRIQSSSYSPKENLDDKWRKQWMRRFVVLIGALSLISVGKTISNKISRSDLPVSKNDGSEVESDYRSVSDIKLINAGDETIKEDNVKGFGYTETQQKQQPSDTNSLVDVNRWTWFNGNLNTYYNDLEKDIKRNPNDVNSFAVHRWLGKSRSTQEHYLLIHNTILKHHHAIDAPVVAHTSLKGEGTNIKKILDAGCGLGAGLTWFEGKEPNWSLVGHTISELQHKFITEKLPTHKFTAKLESYDDLENNMYDVIYSIEALIHSVNLTHTLNTWSQHLTDGGLIIIIDDFISSSTNGTNNEQPDENDEEDIKLFRESWLANSLVSTLEMINIAALHGLRIVEEFDVGTAYDVIKNNYRNSVPEIKDRRKHQGWLGGKLRQKLTVEKKITYRMLVFQKQGDLFQTRNLTALSEIDHNKPQLMDNLAEIEQCSEVIKTSQSSTKFINNQQPQSQLVEVERKWTIRAELMSGKGKDGGKKIACISGWYCCGKGEELWNKLEKERTDNTSFLKLPKTLFGFYLDIFAKHLTNFYSTLPDDATGKFLDIGGTGSVASGMKQVTSKFTHFAGPLEYIILDSDEAARKVENAIVCDIDDCSMVKDCSFDVTFSHTVLEHSYKPWAAFDTIARITKRGGLTMHLVPFSYQYHATPDDSFRFSHKALTSMLEDRGFTILDVGYDICNKPEHMLKRRDEHFDVIWLTYVVAMKN